MDNEQLIESYQKIKTTFNKALEYLDCEELYLNSETLNSVILELADRKDIAKSLSLKEKNALFLIEFYKNFLQIIYPKMIDIISRNTTNIILDSSLIPEVSEINKSFKELLKKTLDKYELSVNTLMTYDPFLKDLRDFKTVFMTRKQPYPDFDYNADSWKLRKQKIEHKISITELFMITRYGEDYKKYMDFFEAGIIKSELENLIPIYNEIFSIKNEGKTK